MDIGKTDYRTQVKRDLPTFNHIIHFLDGARKVGLGKKRGGGGIGEGKQ